MSLGFYAWGEPIFVFIMLALIVMDWWLALRIEKMKNKRIILSLAVFIHLAVFFVFKYLTFVCRNMNLLLKEDIFTVSIALPIGISFFSFQMLSYIFDVYYGNVRATKNLLHVALYVSMFPQLVAGPIVRYETVADEIVSRRENAEEFVEGISRFIKGLAKKVLLANYFGIVTDNIFILYRENSISVMLAWLGAIAYTFQIYFDFSAYSDMAIGLGRVFGFHFNENFNYPYISASVTEFWRRWHISLSTWFRDYIYIPLGGNRCSKKRHVLNIFIVWLFTGIWHGAEWTFIVWGLIYFIFLMIEKNTDIIKKMGWFSHIYTMLVVIIAWVVFRAANMTEAIGYIGAMIGVNSCSLSDSVFVEYIKQGKWLFLMGLIFSTPYYKVYLKKLIKTEYGYQVCKMVISIVIFFISLACLVKSTYNPFIYFNF